MRNSALFGSVVAFAVLVNVSRGETVTFEGLGGPPGNSNQYDSGFTSGSYFFIHGPSSDSFFHLHVGNQVSFYPHNGTTILLPHGDAIMTRSDAGLFTLQSIDLAESVFTLPIHAVGTYADNTTVTAIFTLDGIFDGTGGNPDFQTFSVPTTFSGLKSVELLINGTGHGGSQGTFGIDNIVAIPGGTKPEPVQTPEPGTLMLSLTGLAALGFARRRRKRSAAV